MSPQWCVEWHQLLQAHNSPFSHERLTTTHGATSPTLYEQCMGSFLSHRIYMSKSWEIGHPVYHPYLRRLESVTICRCLYKGSVIFAQLFKDPKCGSSWGLIQQPSVQQTGTYPIELIACEQAPLGVRDIELLVKSN